MLERKIVPNYKIKRIMSWIVYNHGGISVKNQTYPRPPYKDKGFIMVKTDFIEPKWDIRKRLIFFGLTIWKWSNT